MPVIEKIDRTLNVFITEVDLKNNLCFPVIQVYLICI